MVEIVGSKKLDDERQMTSFRIENGTSDDVDKIMGTIFGGTVINMFGNVDVSQMSYDEYQSWLVMNNID